MERDVLLSEVLSQDDLNNYIRKLPPKNRCAFMIERAIPLCDNQFICPYKGKDDYPHLGSRKRECKRDIVLRHKKLLGV